MRHVLLLVVAAGVVTTVGCAEGRITGGPGGPGGADAAMAPTLTTLALIPSDTTITTSDTLAGTADFAATAVYSDGTSANVTSQVAWSLAAPVLGTVVAGHVVASTMQGGATQVQATLDGASTTANLTIKLVDTRILTDDGSTAPANSAMQFAGGTEDPASAPVIAYPLDGTFLPPNLGALEIQWRAPAAPADLYQITLTAKDLSLTAYTNASVLGGGRYTLQDADWQSVASTASGGVVTVTVRAHDKADPTKFGTAQSVSFTVGVDDVQGAIYYWSSTGGAMTEGVQRHAFGDTSGIAAPFYTQSDGYLTPTGANHCVACHVLSADGTKMAVTYDGGDGVAGLIDVATKTPILSATQGLHWNFASFSPDGTRFVGSSGGALTIRDTMTGMPVDSVAPPAGEKGTHPDWSADGKSIVYAAPTVAKYQDDWTFTGGSIVVATDPGAGFAMGTSKVLVQSKGENNYYPSFSPDGKWVLFNRSMNDAYNNGDATVWVVAADGSVGPLHLQIADVMPNTDSWCRWSPFVQHNGPDGDLLYFTNSSKRDYGIELVGQARPQIWMAAFDPHTAAMPGAPPATPTVFTPFWLPFQDTATSNHIAQWTQALVGIQ